MVHTFMFTCIYHISTYCINYFINYLFVAHSISVNSTESYEFMFCYNIVFCMYLYNI